MDLSEKSTVATPQGVHTFCYIESAYSRYNLRFEMDIDTALNKKAGCFDPASFRCVKLANSAAIRQYEGNKAQLRSAFMNEFPSLKW